MADRERKERFIQSFDDRTKDDAILTILRRYGLSAFPDDIVDEIANDLVDEWRSRRRRNRANRLINAARMLSSARPS